MFVVYVNQIKDPSELGIANLIVNIIVTDETNWIYWSHTPQELVLSSPIITSLDLNRVRDISNLKCPQKIFT